MIIKFRTYEKNNLEHRYIILECRKKLENMFRTYEKNIGKKIEHWFRTYQKNLEYRHKT